MYTPAFTSTLLLLPELWCQYWLALKSHACCGFQYPILSPYAAVPPSRYFPRFNPVRPSPEFAGSSRYCPGSQKYICSPIITVHYGLPRSTHINTRSNKSGSSQWTPVSSRWTPGSSRSTYGGHPVNPGQHTVHPGQHTVHYGALQFIPVNTRFITVHYENSDHPSQHQVHYGSSRSTPGSSRSTPGLNFLPGSMSVRPNYQTCLIF